jgi:hypothetical protein
MTLRVRARNSWGGINMAQTMPEVLDYRNLMGKLARIDSEWESLKGMLAFRSPHNKEEPIKPVDTDDALPMDRETNVVGFRAPANPIITHAGIREVSSRAAVTPEELEALTQRDEPYDYDEDMTPDEVQYNHDEALTARLVKVERRLKRLTFLGVAFMTLIIALLAFLTFQTIRDHIIPKTAVVQAEPMTPPVAPQYAEPMMTVSEPQASSMAALPAGEVGLSSETASSPPPAVATVPLVGSITSNKVHYANCKWAKTIKPEKIITFQSVAAARAQGYIPCPVCRPQD